MMHVLNLDTVGGVEVLYINFLEYAWKNDSIIPITSIVGKRAHPLFIKKMKEMRYQPFYERYIYRAFLPHIAKGLAHFKRWLLSSVSSTPLSVYWNIIEQKKSPTPFLYYDHGASWSYQERPSHKKFWQDCVGTICVSEASQAMLQYKTNLTCPSHIIPNPLRPDISIRKTARKAPESPLRLGFIGRLLPIKAPGLAIEALHELIHTYKIDATLTIAGVGREQPFLENLVKKHNLNQKVTFLPMSEEVELFYDSIDILLITSLREPLGLVALEASARGVPVVATCVDGLAESVQDGVSGILVRATEPVRKKSVISSVEGVPELVYDPITKTIEPPKVATGEAFARAIYHLVTTKGLYESMSAGGLEVATSRANFPKYCQDLLHIFHSEANVILQENDDSETNSEIQEST